MGLVCLNKTSSQINPEDTTGGRNAKEGEEQALAWAPKIGWEVGLLLRQEAGEHADYLMKERHGVERCEVQEGMKVHERDWTETREKSKGGSLNQRTFTPMLEVGSTEHELMWSVICQSTVLEEC